MERNNKGEFMSDAKNVGGRPRILKGGKKCTLYLDTKTIEMLKKIGNGVPSKGIRELVEFMMKFEKKGA